jgi:membrane-associated protease RseP (regulator of RpoE activity)
MEILIFIVWVLIAWWCSSIAKKNGRSKVWGFVWGFIFGLLAVIAYAIAGKTREQEDLEFSRRMAMSAKYGLSNKK